MHFPVVANEATCPVRIPALPARPEQARSHMWRHVRRLKPFALADGALSIAGTNEFRETLRCFPAGQAISLIPGHKPVFTGIR